MTRGDSAQGPLRRNLLAHDQRRPVMPARVIRGEINSSRSLSHVSLLADLTFRALIVAVDDYGRADGRPAMLRATLYPTRDEVTDEQLDGWLCELEREGCVRRYEVDGERYVWLTGWEKHRGSGRRALRSRFPAPPKDARESPEIREIREIREMPGNPSQKREARSGKREAGSGKREAWGARGGRAPPRARHHRRLGRAATARLARAPQESLPGLGRSLDRQARPGLPSQRLRPRHRPRLAGHHPARHRRSRLLRHPPRRDLVVGPRPTRRARSRQDQSHARGPHRPATARGVRATAERRRGGGHHSGHQSWRDTEE